MHPARPTPPFARASRALAARTMRESAARCSAPRTARRSARRRARMRGRAPRPRARPASGVRRAHRRSARAPSTRAPRHGVARKRDERRAEVRGARLGQRAGAGRGRALGGGEQIGRTACVSEPVGTPGAAPACSKSGTLPAAVRRRAITADLGRRTVKGVQSARGRRRRKRTQRANAGSYRRSLRGRQRLTSEVPQHDKSREIIGLSINHIENDSRLR